MELEFESRAVQWYGCLVHRADTEEERERERERERAPAAIHSVANYSSAPPPIPAMAGRGSVLFCDGSDGSRHLSSSSPPQSSLDPHLLRE